MMRSEMKNARKPEKKTSAAQTNTIKSISMPAGMWARVESRLSADPELDFSKYVRRLIRRDVEAA